MKHKIFLHDGIIESIYDGPLTTKEATELASAAVTLITGLEDQGKPIRSLVDVRKLTTMDENAYRLLILSLQEFPGDKMAAVGVPKELAQKGLADAGNMSKAEKIKLFDTRDDALKWLQEK